MAKKLEYDSGTELWQVAADDHFYDFYTTREGGRNFRKMISQEMMTRYMELVGDENYFQLEYCFFEIINNAISKGNKFDPEKKIHVYISMTQTIFKTIVEDEGEGFDIGKWNLFYARRKDWERMMKVNISKTGETNLERQFLETSSFNFMNKDSQIEALDIMVSGGTGMVSVVDYFDKVFVNKEGVDASKGTKVLAIKFFGN